MNRTRLVIGLIIVLIAVAGSYAMLNAGPAITMITIPLATQNNSGQTGTAVLTDLGNGKTLVQVTVNGAPADASEPLLIHKGKCEPTRAEQLYPLSDLKNGTSSTTLDTPLRALMSGEFTINGRKSLQQYDAYVLCGGIPSPAAFMAQATSTAIAAQNTPIAEGAIKMTLEETNGSGESGYVILTDLNNGKTLVEATVTGEPTGASQPLTVQEGQCGPTLARRVFILNNLDNGKSTTTIDAPLQSLTNGSVAFAINGHKSADDYHIYVLCGNIPMATAVTGGGAAASPTAPATALPPTEAATVAPTAQPATEAPTLAATEAATTAPTAAATVAPSDTAEPPTEAATVAPTAEAATVAPSNTATAAPTAAPTVAPSDTATPLPPTSQPATATETEPPPTAVPTVAPTETATTAPATAVPPTEAATVGAAATTVPPTTEAATVAPTTAASAVPATEQPTSAPPEATPESSSNTLPATGGDPYSGQLPAVTLLGVLALGIGLMVLRFSRRN